MKYKKYLELTFLILLYININYYKLISIDCKNGITNKRNNKILV